MTRQRFCYTAPRMKEKWAKSALLLGAIAIALFAVERTAAWLGSRQAAPYPVTRFDNPRLVTNSNNYRDYEYPRQKGAGIFRILAVGDSFTQGGGVNFDDIWPKRLERYLSQYENVKGVCYQVLNWGRPGSSTPFEVAKIKDHAVSYGADLIVLGFCLNDVEDEDDRPGVSALRKRHYLQELDRGKGWRAFLFEHSALFKLAVMRLYNTAVNRGQIAYYREIYGEAYPGRRKTWAAIEELGRFRAASGIPVVVMIFPLLSWELDDRYPFAEIHARLHASLEKAGLPYLDLLPLYRGLDHRSLEAAPFKDPHPGDVALRIAAENLYLYLHNNKLLPSGEKIAPDLAARRLAPPWSAPQ